MNINNIVSKLQRNADTLATIYAYYSASSQAGWDLGEMFTEPFNLLMQGKFITLEKLKWRLTEASYTAPLFKNGLILWILSHFAGDLVPSKYASLGKKVGEGLLKGAFIASVAMGASPPADNGHSGSGGDNPYLSFGGG